MAFLTQKGYFVKQLSSGTQAITDITPGGSPITFLPKAIIVWYNNSFVTGYANFDWKMGYGFSDGTNDWAISAASLNEAITNNRNKRSKTASAHNIKVVTEVEVDGTSGSEAELQSFDSSPFGFTLNWTNMNSTRAQIMHFMLFGGDELTDIEVGTFNTLDTSVSLGFSQPDVIFVAGTNKANATDTGSRHAGFNIGVATDFNAAGAFSIGSKDNSSVSSAHRISRDGNIYMAVRNDIDFAIHDNSAVLQFRGSWPANSFTLTWQPAQGGGTPIGYLVMKGGKWKAGSSSSPTTPSITTQGLSFDPNGLMVASYNHPVDVALVTNDAAVTVGGASSAGSQEGVSWIYEELGTAPDGENYLAHDKVIRLAESPFVPAASQQGVDDEADAIFGAGQYQLDWTTADNIAREYWWVTMGPIGGSAVVHNGVFENKSGVSSVVADGSLITGSSATLSSVANLSADTKHISVGSAGLRGEATVLTDAILTLNAEKSLQATASMSADAQIVIRAFMSVQGVASANSDSKMIYKAGSIFQAVANTSAPGALTKHAIAVMSAAAQIDATAQDFEGSLHAVAHIDADFKLQLGGFKTGQAVLQGVANVVASGQIILGAQGGIGGVAEMNSDSAMIVEGTSAHQGVAQLDSESAMILGGALEPRAVAGLSADPTLTHGGSALPAGVALLNSDSSLIYSAGGSIRGVADLTAKGILQGVSEGALAAAASLAADGQLTHTGVLAINSQAALTADPELLLAASGATPGAVSSLVAEGDVDFPQFFRSTPQATAAINADASIVQAGKAVLSGVSVFTPAASGLTFTQHDIITRSLNPARYSNTALYYVEVHGYTSAISWQLHAKVFNITDSVYITESELLSDKILLDTDRRARGPAFSLPSGEKVYRVDFGGDIGNNASFTLENSDIVVISS